MKSYELIVNGKMNPLQMREVRTAVDNRYNSDVTVFSYSACDKRARMNFYFPAHIGKEKILEISEYAAGYFAARDVSVRLARI